MSTDYPGNPEFHSVVDLPDDGTPNTAEAVNVPFKELADNTAFLKRTHAAKAAGPVVFTESGTWTCPEGVSVILVEACGGGGGGGGGAGGSSLGLRGLGGGGGGGALRRLDMSIDVVPGTVYAITIGAGGRGGWGGLGSAAPMTGGGVGAHGGDGGDTILKIQGGEEIARWKGAQGGRCGTNENLHFMIIPGGAPVSTANRPPYFVAPGDSIEIESPAFTFNFGPSYGGDAVTTLDYFGYYGSRPGSESLEGKAGGAAGAHGTPGTGTNYGGGAGAGGGASGYGGGGAGFNGGNGANAGKGSNAATTGGGPGGGPGAGGGGGGAGGNGPGGGGNGSAGMPGVAGMLKIWVRG